MRSRPGGAATLNGNNQNISYTITRRPVVSPGSRETPLPSNVVVDLTTWNAQYFNANFSGTTGVSYVSERSRLPVDPTTGYVDILLNPNGTVVPTTEYSSPSSFGMNSAFYHFWLASGATCSTNRTLDRRRSLPATDGAREHLSRWHSLSPPDDPLAPRAQGRTPADDALHPDRAARHQPGRDVRRDSDPAGPCPNYPFLAPSRDQGDTR